MEEIDRAINIIKSGKCGSRKSAAVHLLSSIINSSFREGNEEQWDSWARTWVLPELKRLVPEIRDALEKEGEQ